MSMCHPAVPLNWDQGVTVAVGSASLVQLRNSRINFGFNKYFSKFLSLRNKDLKREKSAGTPRTGRLAPNAEERPRPKTS